MARRVEMKRAVVASVSSPPTLNACRRKKVGRHAILPTLPILPHGIQTSIPLWWALEGLAWLWTKVYNWPDPHDHHMPFDRPSGPFRSRFLWRDCGGEHDWGGGKEEQ